LNCDGGISRFAGIFPGIFPPGEGGGGLLLMDCDRTGEAK
jgi:hypothetical protein